MRKTVRWMHIASVLSLLLILCSCKMDTKPKEFSCYWEPYASAPKKFPVELLNVDFIMPNQTALSPFDDRFAYLGMGKGICGTAYDNSLNLLLPTRISAQWASFSERKVYSLYADLPTDQLKEWFERGYEIRDSDGKMKKENFKTIDLCLLPGGKAILYVKRGDHRVLMNWEAQAEETHDYDDEIMETNHEKSVSDYFDFTINSNSDWMVVEKNIPFGLWDKYIERFMYYVKMNYENGDSVVTKSLKPSYTNGEAWYVPNYDPRNDMDKMFARPNDMRIIWKDNQYQYTAFFYFNEEETLRLFDEAFGDNRTQHGELEIFVSKYNNLFEISLCVGDKKLVFEKTEIRVFRDPLTDLDGDSERIYKNYDGDHTNILWGE